MNNDGKKKEKNDEMEEKMTKYGYWKERGSGISKINDKFQWNMVEFITRLNKIEFSWIKIFTVFGPI